MFEAKGIDFSQIEDSAAHYEASAPGVGFAAGGGVAKAVEEVIHRIRPEVEVKTVAAEGLDECRKMLRGARTGKYNGYLLEGMACPGGCIAGAGTVQPAEKSRRNLERYKQAAPMANPIDLPNRGVPAHRRRVVCAPALSQKRKQASGFPYTKKLFCQRRNSFFYVIHSLPVRCGSSRTG